MTSGDSRQVRIYQSKGLKLISFIYEQVLGSDLEKWHAASIEELAKIIFHEILQKEQERSTLRIFDESV
jgi:hypothetical protein